jgi:hypothetical protein
MVPGGGTRWGGGGKRGKKNGSANGLQFAEVSNGESVLLARVVYPHEVLILLYHG